MAAHRCLVVLDDDPTGTQTVHDVPILTRWDVRTLGEVVADVNVVYLLTNSRGLSAADTRRLHMQIGHDLATVQKATGHKLEIVSRSDSTLRGHYPLETDTLREALEAEGLGPFDGHVILPFFAEGGRVTAGDVHYIEKDAKRTPVGQTEFARDATFGYTQSDLKVWVEEKSAGRYPAADTVSISLELIRQGGEAAVADRLAGVRDFQPIVVNCECEDDLTVFCNGLRRAVEAGKRFIYRTAASFVRTYGQVGHRALLTPAEMLDTSPDAIGGLVIVGSHVPTTTRQLERLLARPWVTGMELAVDSLVSPDADSFVDSAIKQIAEQLGQGRCVAAYTSRRLATSGRGAEADLAMARAISARLVEIVRKLPARPRYLIAKGGITSSDVATDGLGITKATAMGQVLPGVPVWKQGPEAKYPGGTLVVFPGNVGDDDAVATVADKLHHGVTA